MSNNNNDSNRDPERNSESDRDPQPEPPNPDEFAAGNGPADRYKQTRAQWARAFIPLALDYYCEYWGVDHTRIYSLEHIDTDDVDAFHSEHEAAVRLLKIIDYTGVDVIVRPDAYDVLLSHRFRRAKPESRHPVDFALCSDNAAERTAEYEKYTTAFHGNGFYPPVYGFGIVDPGETHFQEFTLISMRSLLMAESLDMINPQTHTDPAGREHKFYNLDMLDDQNILLARWNTGESALTP